MKPAGAIPLDFQSRDGELLIGGRSAISFATDLGTPCFVYDRGIVGSRLGRLRAAIPAEVEVHYAIKANPYPPLIRYLADRVDGFDVASGGELSRLTGLSVPGTAISFAGPGKRDAELAAAVRVGATINVESLGEVRRLLALAPGVGRPPRVAVRVNPDFELRGSGLRMGGGAKPFGIDAGDAAGVVRLIREGGADWRGFHVYAGTQSLDASAIAEAQAATIALAARLAEEAGAAPPMINLGGGFGIPYFAGDQPLDVEAVGGALAQALAARPPILQGTRFALELGRWIVGEAGVYLSRVVDRKVSAGRTFLVVDGGLHHMLAASGNFGTVVRRNYPVAIASRFAADAWEEVTVVGCLCTPLDLLADDVLLPHAEPGELVTIFMAGAYGASASPHDFLGQGPAAEHLA